MTESNNRPSRIIITVDGLAASGKSSISAALAERLGYVHFSSGHLYRAIGLEIVRRGIAADNSAAVAEVLNNCEVKVHESPPGKCQVLINGRYPGKELYGPEVSQATSISSALPIVRTRLLRIQREALLGRNLVAEGRDMGTIVFPEAQLKFFVSAALEIRAQRRARQSAGGKKSEQALKVLKEKIEIDIRERDKRDSERPYSPTIAAPDAILIDNSREKLTEVVENMYHFVLERGLPH